jgi:hypothetical protein
VKTCGEQLNRFEFCPIKEFIREEESKFDFKKTLATLHTVVYNAKKK